jgi:hypothetical protein
MLHRIVTEHLRTKLLTGSTLAAVLTTAGTASAQIADDPPGSAFQDQGIREDNDLAPFDETRASRAAAYAAYGSVRRLYVYPNRSNHSPLANGRR